MSEQNKLWNLMSVPVPKQYLKDVHFGSFQFTDINAVYDWELLTNIAGAGGNGDTWGWSYEPSDLEIREDRYKDKDRDGNERERVNYTAILKKLVVWINFEGKKYAFAMPGASDNPDAGYALKGAITSAFSKVVAFWGRGIEIYSGGASNVPRPNIYGSAKETPDRQEQDDAAGLVAGAVASSNDNAETIDDEHARALHTGVGKKYPKGQKQEGINAIHAVMTSFKYEPDEKGTFHFSQIKKVDFEKIKAILLGEG